MNVVNALSVGNTAFEVKNKGRQLFYYLTGSNSTDQETMDSLIDPLSAVIGIALLRFKPKGTHISISHRSISFQEPKYLGAAISIGRFWNGDSHEDIKKLNEPLENAAAIYKPEQNGDVRAIFEAAKLGFPQLKDLYTEKKNQAEKDNITPLKNSYQIILNKIQELMDLLTQACDKGVKLENLKTYLANELNNIWVDEKINMVKQALALASQSFERIETLNSTADLTAEDRTYIDTQKADLNNEVKRIQGIIDENIEKLKSLQIRSGTRLRRS